MSLRSYFLISRVRILHIEFSVWELLRARIVFAYFSRHVANFVAHTHTHTNCKLERTKAADYEID